MLFRSSSRLRGLRMWIRAMLWPRKGYRRGWAYIALRVLRLKASDYALAAGFACGIFAVFTPLPGIHFAIGAVLAWLLRGNVVIAVLATLAAGNPWSYPLIWAGSYAIGVRLLEVAGLAAHAPEVHWHSVREFFAFILAAPGAAFIALATGGAVLGMIAALICFCIGFTSANRIRVLLAGARRRGGRRAA